jgi:hypothetical protein
MLVAAGATISYCDVSRKDKYPDEYSFERARAFADQGELEVALWYYINLFPEDSERVVNDVVWLAGSHEDISTTIVLAFGMMAPFDPQISDMSGGGLVMNGGQWKVKSAWGDSLRAAVIRAVGEGDPTLPIRDFLVRDYEEINASVNDVDRRLLNTLQKDIFNKHVKARHWYFRARQGRTQEGYGQMHTRLSVSHMICRDAAVRDSLVTYFLYTREVDAARFWKAGWTDGVKSPPFLMAVWSNEALLVDARCEDFETPDNWTTLTSEIIAAMQHTEGLAVVRCQCGGPLTVVEATDSAR